MNYCLFVYFSDELRAVVAGFAELKGFPNCGGSLDGCHIPILTPAEHGPDYINRKNWASLVLQATVDSKSRFTSCYVGFPGGVHDARVFANSSLPTMLDENTLFGGATVEVLNERVPVCLVADAAYPLKPNLLKVLL